MGLKMEDAAPKMMNGAKNPTGYEMVAGEVVDVPMCLRRDSWGVKKDWRGPGCRGGLGGRGVFPGLRAKCSWTMVGDVEALLRLGRKAEVLVDMMTATVQSLEPHVLTAVTAAP